MADRVISQAELAVHNTSENLWVAVKGEVFDVTSFQDEHPGGASILAENAGKDATEEFEMAGHGPDAMEMTRSYVIGKLEGSEHQQYSPSKPLFGAASTSHSYTKLAMAGAIVAAVAIAVYFVGRKK